MTYTTWSVHSGFMLELQIQCTDIDMTQNADHSMLRLITHHGSHLKKHCHCNWPEYQAWVEACWRTHSVYVHSVKLHVTATAFSACLCICSVRMTCFDNPGFCSHLPLHLFFPASSKTFLFLLTVLTQCSFAFAQICHHLYHAKQTVSLSNKPIHCSLTQKYSRSIVCTCHPPTPLHASIVIIIVKTDFAVAIHLSDLPSLPYILVICT